MTTTLTAQPRRQSANLPRPPRDLPVLFHLQDVSRPRGYPPKPDEPRAYFLEPATSSLPAESSTAKAEELLDKPNDLAAAIADAAQPAIPAPEFMESEALSTGTAESAADEAAATGETPSSSLLEIPPASGDAVALRQRAGERQRKRQASTKDDWFAMHGKYIAVGFVVALLLTIYAARTRRPVPPEVARPAHEHKDKPPATVRTASAEKPLPDKSAARPAVAITSVGPSRQAAGQSQTALHPPTIPQLAAEPGPSPASDGLFPWAKRDAERMAARTDVTSPAAASAAAASAAGAADATAARPSAEATPHEQHRYPSTPFGGHYRPAPAPAAAPEQPAPSQPPSQPLYPTTNSPSGYRHERTGSGFH
jgi:hypothetical protein